MTMSSSEAESPSDVEMPHQDTSEIPLASEPLSAHSQNMIDDSTSLSADEAAESIQTLTDVDTNIMERDDVTSPNHVRQIGNFNRRLQATPVAASPSEPERQPLVQSRKRKRKTKQQGPVKISYKDRMAESSIRGRRTIPLRVLPVSKIVQSANSGHPDLRTAGNIVGVDSADTEPKFFSPARLLDIERGEAVLVTNHKFLGNHRFEELEKDEALIVTARSELPSLEEENTFAVEHGESLQEMMAAGDFRDFQSTSETGIVGGAWRGTLRRIMMWASDDVNNLRLSRQLQPFLAFLAGHESYLLGQVIECLDGSSKADLKFVLQLAFRNRNVSRILVQTIGTRWDFLWHWHHQVTGSKLYDAWGQFPLVGFTRFPPTENFPATRDHAIASSTRVLLGEGLWLTRVLTQNRQGLNTDDPEKNIAQNLAAESNGFEVANRNQYGNYAGRQHTKKFRLDHRLPVDESIVRTFVAQPFPTMINNGVVHTLQQLARHWRTTLKQPEGNFAHQRMEQLDPFETMRFHMPVVCLVLSSLRGRNEWDTRVLGPFMRRCQELRPSSSADECRNLVNEMKDRIILDLCAGVASVVDPLRNWLDCIGRACALVEEEAKLVYQKVTAVEIGLRLGHDLLTQVSWKVPNDKELEEAILLQIQGKKPGSAVSDRRIRSALHMTTPRDKRTLIELVKAKLAGSEPAKLLLARVKTLLQRDIRRDALNAAIKELSMGDYTTELLKEEWYWIEDGKKKAVYIYDGPTDEADHHVFIHADSGFMRVLDLSDDRVLCRSYIPVAESISRAQKCFMDIELEHGKKFKYNAFMEFSYLRVALRRLAVISQIFCEELDNARLNILKEFQRSDHVQVEPGDMETGKTYYVYDDNSKQYNPTLYAGRMPRSDWEGKRTVNVPPQSVIVVGGGPSGLMTVIHCTESVILSGGEMKLYEARDSFNAGAAAFERAQIVRLDARWISMLRYYLGTGFEDIYIPASGETDAQLGNTLPTQGFVEVTIKDLESMLHVEVSRMWSKGLIQCFTQSRAQYDIKSNALVKLGEHLKIDDHILRNVDPDGKASDDLFVWKVSDLRYPSPLGLDDLRIGREYGVYNRKEDAILPFKLTSVDLQSRMYTFESLEEGIEDLRAAAHNLPSVYPKGKSRHAEASRIVVESVHLGSGSINVRQILPIDEIRGKKFILDVGSAHVVECTGKPHESTSHLRVTTSEPYGVCCIQGLKISMCMHNFGGKRWGSGLLDDFRSSNDQNTRIVGDFTKMVRQPKVAEEMLSLVKSLNWKAHFTKVFKEVVVSGDDFDAEPLLLIVRQSVMKHAIDSKTYKRQTLQTRFFETGDNYYLGMEFTREYNDWKKRTAGELTKALASVNQQEAATDGARKAQVETTIMGHIDRLWYEACLETIRRGDVYNPGARHRVPRLHIIDSYKETEIANLPIGESFRLSTQPTQRYEILIKEKKQVIVRNVEGYLSRMANDSMVFREGNLTRAPDGNRESKVAIATFPVSHYVNFRTAWRNTNRKGYLFASVGDQQATPHFMRYSGLTGACVNAMLLNNFIRDAINGKDFGERLKAYSVATDWSNSEVVTRGTGSLYGRDGFLRPGFSYGQGLEYLRAKVIEGIETQQDMDKLLSDEWKKKFSASMIPRGMEFNESFIDTFYSRIHVHLLSQLVDELHADPKVDVAAIPDHLLSRTLEISRDGWNSDDSWREYLDGLSGIDDTTMSRIEDFHLKVLRCVGQNVVQLVEFSRKEYLYNRRTTSGMFAQPKAVDSIVDDFAVEAQSIANSLAMSAAFSAGALAFVLLDLRSVDSDIGRIFGSILGGLNILISFGTMTNVSRYKIRNEEARITFYDNKFIQLRKGVFAAMSKEDREQLRRQKNPFYQDLEIEVQKFLSYVKYYGAQEPHSSGFIDAYMVLMKHINSVDAIRDFEKTVTTLYIGEIYHENSCIQECLVDIVRKCQDMVRLLEVERSSTGWEGHAKDLFVRLDRFEPILKKSLQRGHIAWGFLKRRRLVHWDIFVVLRYFWSLFCCATSPSPNPVAPIQTETLGILRQTRALSEQNDRLGRESRDLEHLYWATRESDVASMVFVSAVLVHIVSWVFSIARIVSLAGGPSGVTDVAAWASIASALGAILGAFHFQRKLIILVRLSLSLDKKVREANGDDRGVIEQIRTVTWIQALLTLLRLLSACGAAVALPWSIAVSEFSSKVEGGDELPFWIALGAVGIAILSTILFFIVEFQVRYNLSPRLGEFICEAFRGEIEDMYKPLSLPMNDMDPKQEQERETWEYVAREFLHKYRFDTVFAADRFGSILQYIQSGMDRRK